MFDLSEGATTFRVFMEATSEEYKNISTYVVFKYRSVTIGDNDDYYTIEDALTKADSGDMVYVKYNTSLPIPTLQRKYITVRTLLSKVV